MKRDKIIVLGSLAFDYIMTFEENFVNAVSIDHEKEEYQSTVTAKSRIQHYGGTAGNIAFNLGLLNISKVSLLGSVGKDFESLGYKSHITRFKNIELNVDVREKLFTAACYIVNDIKANQMIIFHGGALDESKNIDLRQKIQNPEQYVYAINSTQGIEAMTNFSNQLEELKIQMISKNLLIATSGIICDEIINPIAEKFSKNSVPNLLIHAAAIVNNFKHHFAFFLLSNIYLHLPIFFSIRIKDTSVNRI